MQIIKKIKVLFLLLGIAVVCDAQTLIGDELKGKLENDYFGESVSMSADGEVVAIGSPRNNENHKTPGYARVFKLVNGAWQQLGGDIDGIRIGDRFGYSVALSADGTRLIASAYSRFEGARVYDFKDGNWLQVGKDIHIRHAKDVVISSNGNIIAIGNWNASQPHGAVKVFEWKDGEWAQLGNDIYGKAEKDQSAWSLSLSSDGKTLAIGSINNIGEGRSGYVRVFRFNGGEWVLLGKSIAGKESGYAFGRSISMSANGNRVAISGPGSLYHGSKCCYVAIYDFINGEWTAVGQELNGFPNEIFGNKVVLSGDGERVAILTTNNINCPVRIYDLIDGEWNQVGKSIKYELEPLEPISSICMSRNGKVITVATHLATPAHARVYDISKIKAGENVNDDCEIEPEEKEEEEIEKFKIYPNPTSGIITVEGVDLDKLRESQKLQLFDMLGRRMGGYDVQEDTINLSNLPSGTYFLKLDDRIEKIIVTVF